MLRTEERLSRAAFAQYFAVGKRTHGTYFTVVYSPAPVFKAAVVVSKKVAKKAHDRNRLKRQLYHLLAAETQKNPRTGAYLVFVKPGAALLSRAGFRLEFLNELSRVPNTR